MEKKAISMKQKAASTPSVEHPEGPKRGGAVLKLTSPKAGTRCSSPTATFVMANNRTQSDTIKKRIICD